MFTHETERSRLLGKSDPKSDRERDGVFSTSRQSGHLEGRQLYLALALPNLALLLAAIGMFTFIQIWACGLRDVALANMRCRHHIDRNCRSDHRIIVQFSYCHLTARIRLPRRYLSNSATFWQAD